MNRMVEENNWTNEIDSKYRLVLLAARRSKQLQRGAPAKIRSAARKFTRLALEEAQQGMVHYEPIVKPAEDEE